VVLFLVVGLLGSGLLALYPRGALGQAASDHSLRAPLHMALVALPSQMPPLQGSMFLSEMLLMGVSFAMVFVFLLLGVGVIVGTLAWIAWAFGLRVMLCVVPLVVGVTLVAGYAFPVTLPNLSADAAEGHHFLEVESTSGPEIAWKRAKCHSSF
jgi:hypothetical protein